MNLDIIYRLKSAHRRARIFHEFERARVMSLRGPAPPPISVWLEPTSKCNYKCIKCPHGTGLKRELGDMDWELFTKIMEEISPFAKEIKLHHTGESFLHPRLFDMTRACVDAGIFTTLATNGSLVDKNDYEILRTGIHVLCFSVDSTEPDEYDELQQGVPIAHVQEKIREVLRRRTNSKIKININLKIVIREENAETSESTIKEYESWGFDDVRAVKAFDWPGHDTGYNDYRSKDYEVTLSGRVIPCARPYMQTAILFNGDVVACDIDGDGSYILGNLREEKFLDIWRNEKAQKLRSFITREPINGEPPNICVRCPLRELPYPQSRLDRSVFAITHHHRNMIERMNSK